MGTERSWLFEDDVQTGRTMIELAVERGMGDTWVEAFAPVNELIAQVKALDVSLSMKLDSAVAHVGCTLEDAAGLLGFALAKTWPTGPEGLDSWIARAQASINKSE